MAEGEVPEVVEEEDHSIMAKEVIPIDVFKVRWGAHLICHFCRWIWDIWLQQQC